MREFDRHTAKAIKFNLRQFFDPKNHERREKRMIERAQERIKDHHTFYLNGFNEGEIQYKDYYETE